MGVSIVMGVSKMVGLFHGKSQSKNGWELGYPYILGNLHISVVGKCPDVSHHPTIGDISSPTEFGLVMWSSKSPIVGTSIPTIILSNSLPEFAWYVLIPWYLISLRYMDIITHDNPCILQTDSIVGPPRADRAKSTTKPRVHQVRATGRAKPLSPGRAWLDGGTSTKWHLGWKFINFGIKFGGFWWIFIGFGIEFS